MSATNQNARTVLGGIAAISVLIFLIALGRFYTKECLAKGRDFEKCWDKGLAIAGMPANGQLGIVQAIAGYLIGIANKEKEKKLEYDKGYWTLNPNLHKDQ